MNEFQIKTLIDVLKEILKENTLYRKLKGIFLFEKYYINKSRVQNLIKEVQEKKSNTLLRDFIFFISGLDLSDELKLDSYFSIYSFLYDKFRDNISELKHFIESFCKTNFKLKKVKNPEFNSKYKKLTRILISDLYERLDEDNKSYFIPLITSLFETYYKLVKINVAEGVDYINLFTKVYDNIPSNFQNLRKWILHFDFYLTIENDLNTTLEIIKSFLIYYDKDLRMENYRERYPNPVEFLEVVRKRFLKVKKQKSYNNFLLEFYLQNTTNYIPTFFLRKKELNNPKILKIIKKNFEETNFDLKYLDEVYDLLINHKPDKHSFYYYCTTIAALYKQYLSVSSIKLNNFKKLNLNQKFKLFIVIYRKNPEIREYPSNLYEYLIEKKRYIRNQELLQNYLELIKISENYREFWDIYHNFYIYNEESKKNIKNFSEKTWQKFKFFFLSILEKSEFSIFEKLFNFFTKDNIYNFYLNEDTKSLEEFVKKEFAIDSSYLILFLYPHFINKAIVNNNWDLSLKIINEFQSFKEVAKITGNSLDFFLGRDPLRKENYKIEFHHLISLIRSGRKAKLKEFLEQSVKKELESDIKDLSKIAFIKFLSGNFMKSREYFQMNIDDLERPQFFSINKTFEKIQEDNMNISKFFIELIDFELKSTKLGSIKEFKRELSKMLDEFDDCVKKHSYRYPYIWHFPLFVVYLHYVNLDKFCIFIEKYEKNSTDKNLEYYLDRLINTDFCYEWDNLKNVWKIIIGKIINYDNQLNPYENQYEIFIRNPLFKGVSEVFKKSFPIDSPLYNIFNYKPDKLLTEENKSNKIYQKIEEKYPECYFQLKNQLDELNFRKICAKLSPSGELWLKIIRKLFGLLRASAKEKGVLRERAQSWESEEKDMSPWTNQWLEERFSKKHVIKPQISDGHSDHFIDNIALEDKLLRTSENLNNINLIEEKYKREKRQVKREGLLSGFQILLIVDIRIEVKENKIDAIRIPECFKIFHEEGYWTAAFLFQIFTETPSNLK